MRGAPVLLVGLLLTAPIFAIANAEKHEIAADGLNESSLSSAPYVSNWSITPAPPLNITSRQIAISLVFNTTMNNSVAVNVTMGLPLGHDNTTVVGAWKRPNQWVGNATIPLGGHDGANRLRASGGEDTSGTVMTEFLSSTFTVDTLAPTSTANELPPFVNTRNITIVAAVADATSTLAFVDFYVNATGGGWSFAQRLTVPPWRIVYAAPADGRYEFFTLAGDALGNNESLTSVETSTVVDTVAPTSSIVPIGAKAPGMQVNVTATASDANPLSSVRLYWRKIGPWHLWAQDNSTPYQFVFNVSGPGMGSGVYELASGSTDIAGNVELPPSAGNDTFVVFDLGAPLSSLDPLPKYSGSTVNITTQIVNSAGILDTIELWADSGGGFIQAIEGPSGKFAYNPSAEGKYQFYSILVSRSGEREAPPAGNDSWTIVDLATPQVIASVPAHNARGVPLDTDFTFQLTEPVSLSPGNILFDLDGSPLLGSWNPVNPTLLVFDPVQDIVGERTHAARVDFRDLAGNPGSYSFAFSTEPLVPAKAKSTPKDGEAVGALNLIRVVFSVDVTAAPGAESITGPAQFTPVWDSLELVVTVEDAKPGDYTLSINSSRVHDPQGLRLDGDGDGVPGGDFEIEFTFRPAPPARGRMIVRVADAQGVPLSGARVVLELRGTIVNDSLADQVGRLELIEIPPGTYNVTASKEGYHPMTKTVIVPPGGTTPEDFALDTAGPVNPAFIVVAVLLFVLMVGMMLYGYIHSHRKDRKAAAKGDEEPVLAARDTPLEIVATPGVDAGEVDVKWETSNADTRYVLMISKDGTMWEDLVGVPRGIDSFTVDELKPGSKQHFKLRSRLLGGKTVESNVAVVTVRKTGTTKSGPKPAPIGEEEETPEVGPRPAEAEDKSSTGKP